MSSVGETLRRERVRRNLSLEQIATETKISTRLLSAIENEQFDRLPGGVFAKSFVRQYAQTLGLDADELAAEVERTIQPEGDVVAFPHQAPLPAARPEFRVPKVTEWEGGSARPSSSALPSLALVVVVMLVCSGIYAWWQKSRRPAPAPVTVPAAAQTAASRPPAKPVETQPSPVTAPPQTAAVQAAVPASAPPAVTEPPAAPNPAATLHVTLSADEVVWVRAWADGKQVMTATLQPTVVKTVEAVDEIRLRTGNAGSLHVAVNGKPLEAIGPKGQIRIVQITPKGVQIEVPPKPAPPVPAPAPL